MFLAPLLLVPSLYAALPATPDDRPGLPVAAWLTVSNDFLGIPQGPDDNRTAEAALGLQSANWAVVLDDSMLTHFTDAAQQHGERCDDVTLALWYKPSEVWLGAAARARGNLGGGLVQNWWHRLGTGHVSNIVYPDRPVWSPLFGVAIRHSWNYTALIADAWIGADGDFMSDSEFRFYVCNAEYESAAWIGLRWQERHAGSQACDVVRDVYKYEEGPWLTIGVRSETVSFETRYSFWHNEGVGAISLSINQ
jgi:hypothetical protein